MLPFQNYRMSSRYHNNPSWVRTGSKKYKQVLGRFQHGMEDQHGGSEPGQEQLR